MITRIDPPLPLETPRGRGYAHFVIDYSQEHHWIWVVFLDESGECWFFQNPEIRLQTSLTMGRETTSTIAPSPISLVRP